MLCGFDDYACVLCLCVHCLYVFLYRFSWHGCGLLVSSLLVHALNRIRQITWFVHLARAGPQGLPWRALRRAPASRMGLLAEVWRAQGAGGVRGYPGKGHEV